MAAVKHPPLDVVQDVVTSIQRRGGVAALGGSGLLAALGLVDVVVDWDLTTDSPQALVATVLADLPYSHLRLTAGDTPFASEARFAINGGAHAVDIIVRFAVRGDQGETPIATRVTGEWLGLPIGDPMAWAVAYRAIGRFERAGLLEDWARQ